MRISIKNKDGAGPTLFNHNTPVGDIVVIEITPDFLAAIVETCVGMGTSNAFLHVDPNNKFGLDLRPLR